LHARRRGRAADRRDPARRARDAQLFYTAFTWRGWVAGAWSKRKGPPRRRPFACREANRSADDFFGLEEVVDLDLGVLVAVRTVDRVGLDALGESLADRAFGGVGGVGRAHHFAVALHRVVALEHLHDDRAAGHEADEIAEERALLVDGVEAFRLLAGHLDALRGDD